MAGDEARRAVVHAIGLQAAAILDLLINSVLAWFPELDVGDDEYCGTLVDGDPRLQDDENEARPHQGIAQVQPVRRSPQIEGTVVALPVLGTYPPLELPTPRLELPTPRSNYLPLNAQWKLKFLEFRQERVERSPASTAHM